MGRDARPCRYFQELKLRRAVLFMQDGLILRKMNDMSSTYSLDLSKQNSPDLYLGPVPLRGAVDLGNGFTMTFSYEVPGEYSPDYRATSYLFHKGEAMGSEAHFSYATEDEPTAVERKDMLQEAARDLLHQNWSRMQELAGIAPQG